MKKILTNNIVENVRRQPFNKASYDHLQESYQEVIEDIMKALTGDTSGVVVLYGCEDSDPDANDYDISAGAVLYNGEIFRVDAFVGSDPSDVPVLVMDETFREGDPVTFSDNNEYNVHAIRKLKWQMAGTGTGITDFSDLVRMPFNINDGFYDHTENSDSGGGQVTVVTIPYQAGKSLIIDATLIATRVSGAVEAEAGGTYRVIKSYHHPSGVITVLGTDILTSNPSGSSVPSSIQFSVSGTNILLRVQSGSGSVYRCRVIAKAYFN